jgi:preprotein translocase subunit SecG
MYLFVVSLHVLLCLLLITSILLQPGRSGMGGAFGGGGNAFGPRGQASLLSRLTTGVAVLFMVTSVSLALFSDRSLREGVDVDDALEQLQGASIKSEGESSGSPETTAPTGAPMVEGVVVSPEGEGAGQPVEVPASAAGVSSPADGGAGAPAGVGSDAASGSSAPTP